LAFGRDLARSFAAQQTLARRLRDASVTAKQLLTELEQQSPPETGEEMTTLLEAVRTLTHQLLDQTQPTTRDARDDTS
jgi:hypothetical protein